MSLSLKRQELVKQLKNQGYIHSKKVEEAFLAISREDFIPDRLVHQAYVDHPLDIGFNQTISAPHMVALMTEAMDLLPGQKVLEIGTGSGYHAAIVAHIIGKTGKLYTVERFEDLAEKARITFEKKGIDNVTVIVGDGSLGLKEYAPYDCIYVTCSAPNVPQSYKDQIKTPGLILIPIGRVYGELIRLTKEKNGFYKKSYGGCAFVPLIGEHGFNNNII